MKKLLFFLMACSFSGPLFAHANPATGGFSAGLLHPVLGFDHLLAMVSVGVVSAQIGGRSIWLIPLIFVSAMLMGGMTGIYGIPIPYFSIEQGIAASVLILGLAIAADRSVPVILISLFVGFFGIFHGHAHGLEMPENALPVLYITGFICGTASLHILGVIIGLLSKKSSQTSLLLRFVGSAIAGIGVSIMFLR